MKWLTRAARIAGIALMIAGVLLLTREVFREDRQQTLLRGSVQTVQDRPKFAPGWGILSLLAGGGLVAWSRRSVDRRADENHP